MELSLNIILEELDDFSPLCYVLDRSVKFTGIYPFSGEPAPADKLTVCRLSQVLDLPENNANYFVTLIDCKLPKDSKALKNMILLDKEITLPELFIRIQNVFDKYTEWCSKMDQCLINNNESIQSILTLSENIIDNYITISDSAFSLVAYTSNLTTSDELTQKLVRNGCHDQDAINKFSKLGLPMFWRNANEIYEKTESVTSCPIMGKVIHYNHFYYSHVIMLCEKHPLSPGLRDKFSILIDKLMVCFERQWKQNNQMPHVYDSLLLELLEGKESDSDTMRIRAKNAGIPTNGCFMLMKVIPENNNGTMRQRLCQELLGRIPQSRVTLNKETIIALIILKKPGDAESSVSKNLHTILEEYDSKCGISEPFESITGIRTAGKQCDIALKSGFIKDLFISRFNGNKNDRVAFFADCYPAYIMAGTKESYLISKETWACRALQSLFEYDQKHNTNNLELLYFYLINERKASETAQIVHMHRNNVIYRIGKISEIIGLDLENSGVRLRLLMAYEIFSPKEK